VNESKNGLLRYHDLIAGIAAAMEARDPDTALHSLRVASMTECMCGLAYRQA